MNCWSSVKQNFQTVESQLDKLTHYQNAKLKELYSPNLCALPAG
jgi:hypothetical protein